MTRETGGRTGRGPSRILMTVDAVGGVWRYAMDLAAGLRRNGVETVFLGFGPRPSDAQVREASAAGQLVWSSLPLDWLTDDEAPLEAIPEVIIDVADRHGVDLIHLNLPSQAAGLVTNLPVVVVSHSCVVTWFHTVRGESVPAPWQWQVRRNRQGMERADVVIAPSRSHADGVRRCYGTAADIRVVPNASAFFPAQTAKADIVFSAGRWWDDGKNGRVLDQAARHVRWPVLMAGAMTGPNGQHLPVTQARPLGDLPHDEAMTVMAQAAIVVSPSLYEPFGLAALEAARAGAALVLADISTYRELWDGAALFANPHNPPAFATAINQLAEDPDLRARLGETARLRSQAFSPEAQAQAVLYIYSGLTRPARQLTAAE